MILDCTFRDGGYYVNWDFDKNLVIKYLKSVEKAKIDILEMGFRFLPKNTFQGAFAYTTDEYLESLPLPKSARIAVMVNADELLSYKNGLKAVVKILFKKKSNSPVDIVRIATDASNISLCHDLVILLNKLGYRVYLNLMKADSLKLDEVTKIAKEISSWRLIETFYFADSFGNMEPDKIQNIVKAIKKGWFGNIGFHAHDNKSLALSNCISALQCGVDYIDGTLSGMGRGAGNVKTENLLIELTTRGYGNYKADEVFSIVMDDFKKLQDKYQWGPSVYYHLSAKYSIHPTYIQEMLADNRYTIKNILSTINFLKSKKSASYSSKVLLKALSNPSKNYKGKWLANDFCEKRTVLILASGENTKNYLSAIGNFIMKKKPLVFCLNINKSVPDQLIDYYVACNQTRIFIELKDYNNLGKPLILPISSISNEDINTLNRIKILDYGLQLKINSIEIHKNGCILPNSLALFYAISVATAGGAERILLAGADGFNFDDTRQQDMIELFNKYKNLKNSKPLLAITPTSLPVKQVSIFDPSL
jgi:4-hydroxy 2-oxovalerate aldolase